MQRGWPLVFATWGFTGYAGTAPGTVGSLAGLPVAYGVMALGLYYGGLVVAGLVALSVVASEKALGYLEGRDPKQIVCDEVCGLSVALMGVSPSVTNIILGFIIFRFFDILKPFPIGTVERRLSGGVAIVADDVLAGIYTNIVVSLLEVAW